MREADFLEQLHALLDADVKGLTDDQKASLVSGVAFEWSRAHGATARPALRIVPFITGRRPTDEARHPGLGSSDHTSMILKEADARAENHTYILYQLSGLEQYSAAELDGTAIDITLSFAGTDGSLITSPIPGWDRRIILPQVFVDQGAGDSPTLKAIGLEEISDQNLVVRLSPDQDLLPGEDWDWEDLDAQIQELAADTADPFTFGHLFSQVLHVHMRLTVRDIPIASAQTRIDVYDTPRFGSLYRHIVDCMIKPDTEKQAREAGLEELDHAYHPWFPVLLIGSDKAALYTRALREDIVHKKLHLANPRWLARVGLYLEFLTCIGIFEAVKEELGDLLTPSEREVYENSPVFAEIRRRVNPDAWREVWALRQIVFPRFGTPQTGPVSALNLRQKKKATLAFLKVHHDDLKNAIDLAGPNEHNSQETWHRVFRDAERAVLRKTQLAFPELAFLNPNVQEFVHWHQKGKLDIRGMHWIPGQFSKLFGDQDGLFASACNQYRASMNEVANWAKKQGLMDYTGEECVPELVSLLEAFMARQESQLERLQRRDGYAGGLDIVATPPSVERPDSDEIYELMSNSAIFSMLTPDELHHLARTALRIEIGPMERVIVQGQEGSSLFVVGDGELEVLVRQADGVDHVIDKKRRGEIFGEMSLLTGKSRSATVRAEVGATVYKIGKKQYAPIIRSRPELVDVLANLMEEHERTIRDESDAYDSDRETEALSGRIKHFFFGR
jgi:hypothetical protein